MAAEIILRVKVDKSQYKAFQAEVKKGLDVGGTDKASKSLKGVGDAAQQSTSKLASLGEMLTKKIAWYSISMAISSVTVAFKEAFNEIKNVDTQLTNVAKVSGKTLDDLRELSNKAYSTASKYGVEASKYMEAVYEYTKAGFQDNADVMAELSTKAMLVGDTTAAVADKFLIAANAAWNYGKNVEELSLLVDKADYINNNYATTFDKIADGFPRVASVAAMAGMSAEQTMAALGTITATTQETASRAGTALRALVLNLLKDTSSEVEEGVTVTKDQIKDLSDVLQVYAKDVVDAANASGKLINPMDALAALAKAYKENALTERDLFTIENALGGKLRTNQLDALLKNFDTTYTSMMKGMVDAYGTADKEIETMLGSWEAKSQILKNTWTEFISKTVDSGKFKDMLDWATNMLDRFDNIGNLLPSIAMGMAAMFAPAIIKNAGTLLSRFKDIGTVIGSLAKGIKPSANAISGAISAILTVITIAYTAYKNKIMKIRQDAEKTADEAVENANAAAESTKSLSDLYKAYKDAEAANDGSKTAKQELKTATENLAVALGYEKSAIDSVTESWDTLTEREKERQKDAVDLAVRTAQSAVLEAGWTYGTSNPIINAAMGSRQNIGARGGEGVWYGYGSPYGEEDPAITNGVGVQTGTTEEAFISAVAQYKTTQKKLEAYRIALTASSYDAIKAADLTHGVDSVQAEWVREAYAKYQGNSPALREEIKELESNLEEASLIGKYIEALDAQKAYNEAIKNFGKDSEEAAKAAAEAAEKEKELADEEEKQRKAAEDAALAQKRLADAFSEVAGGAESAKKALQDYQDALDANYVEENADAYAQAAQKALEAIQKGFVDSPEITEFAKLYFGEAQYNAMLKQGKNMAKELVNDPYFQRLYVEGTDENGKTVFRDSLDTAKELAKIMKEWDTDGNNILTVDKDGQRFVAARLVETDEGLKIIVEDWKLLEEGWGMAAEQLKSLLDYYGFLIPGMESGTKEILAAADAAGALYDAAGGIKQIDLGRVIEGAFKSGKTEYEVDQIVKDLQELAQSGDIELTIDDSQIKEADDATKAYLDKLDKTDVKHVTRLEIEDKQAQAAMDKMLAKEKQIDQFNPTVTITAKDIASDKIEQIKERLRGIPSEKTIAIKLQSKSGATMEEFASGTDSAIGGSALVNEEGAELIAANGRAWIAGGGKPTIANIPKGAKIWTAKETKAILGNSNLAELYSGIGAFANGTISKIPTTTSASKARLGADLSDNKHLKRLQDIVSLRKSELSLIEESGGSITRQIKKQQSIQKSLVDEIKYLQKVGGRQEDINALATEWYQIESSIAELEEQKAKRKEEERKEAREKERALYDDLQTAVSNRMDEINKKRDAELEKVDAKIKKLQEEHDLQKETNDLKEKELAVEKAREALDNAKKQRNIRVYNATTGKWGWTYNASTVASARESWQSARQDLKDYKSEKAYEEKIAKLEAEQTSINEKFDTQISKWQKVLDAIEEPVISINKALQNIEDNATKHMLPTINKINEALDNLGRKGISTKGVYDSGGVLSGLGGIKGTSADEMILPPDITRRMLRPMGSKMFSQRLNELRYLYGATGSLAGMPFGGIGSQHNGDVYSFGNITLSKEQAMHTSVYDLARMAKGLRSYSSAM